MKILFAEYDSSSLSPRQQRRKELLFSSLLPPAVERSPGVPSVLAPLAGSTNFWKEEVQAKESSPCASVRNTLLLMLN